MKGVGMIVVGGEEIPCCTLWAKGGQALWELCKVCNPLITRSGHRLSFNWQEH